MKVSELMGYMNRIQDYYGDIDINIHMVYKNYPIDKPLERVFISGKFDVKENALEIKRAYVVLS